MKALTVQQPWATLLATGRKRIETRSWKTKYRGPIAIHAAARISPVVNREILNQRFMRVHPVDSPIPWALHMAGYSTWGEDVRPPERMRRSTDGDDKSLPLGKILAIAELVDVRPIVACSWNRAGWMLENGWDGNGVNWWDGVSVTEDVPFGDWRPGRYAWLFKQVQELDVPIPAKGALSLWEWDAPKTVVVSGAGEPAGKQSGRSSSRTRPWRSA